MRNEPLEGMVVISKPVRNSQVVREMDPRASRELWGLLVLVAVLVGGLALYAWPHLALRQTGMAAQQLSRVRERMIEENRKLRLEKASLEDLKRVESIALRDLGLVAPPPERVIVVERPRPVPDGARLAQGRPGEGTERN
jgi:cell division protein FtsL